MIAFYFSVKEGHLFSAVSNDGSGDIIIGHRSLHRFRIEFRSPSEINIRAPNPDPRYWNLDPTRNIITLGRQGTTFTIDPVGNMSSEFILLSDVGCPLILLPAGGIGIGPGIAAIFSVVSQLGHPCRIPSISLIDQLVDLAENAYRNLMKNGNTVEFDPEKIHNAPRPMMLRHTMPMAPAPDSDIFATFTALLKPNQLPFSSKTINAGTASGLIFEWLIRNIAPISSQSQVIDEIHSNWATDCEELTMIPLSETITCSRLPHWGNIQILQKIDQLSRKDADAIAIPIHKDIVQFYKQTHQKP